LRSEFGPALVWGELREGDAVVAMASSPSLNAEKRRWWLSNRKVGF